MTRLEEIIPADLVTIGDVAKHMGETPQDLHRALLAAGVKVLTISRYIPRRKVRLHDLQQWLEGSWDSDDHREFKRRMLSGQSPCRSREEREAAGQIVPHFPDFED